MIKCFYYKEIFIEYLKDIKFVDRTKTKGMDNILNSKENRELFIKMFNEGSLYKDMCKIFNISEDTLKKVLKELGLKERERGYKVFQYNKYGEKINTFKDRNSVIKEFGDIDLSTSKKRRFSKGYFWSKEELKFNSLEKIYGKFIVCEKTVIFSYNKDGFYKIFKDVREASNELGFSKFLIRESLKNGREAKGYIFKNINKIPEEEINKILELKINNKESV